MKKFTCSVFVIGTLALLSACVAVPNTTAVPASFQAYKILAVGYGAMGGGSSTYTVGQQKLMAMRAARIDAYRNLAEQVYGFRIWGNTAVSAFSTQNDNVRTYIDSFIRGARVVNMTPIADGNFEATVELELTPAFLSCVSNAQTCGIPVGAQRENQCAASGCVQPSGYYYTNQ